MNMENAILIIEAYKEGLENSCSNLMDADIESFALAIKAMKEYRPNGEWVSDPDKNWVLRCSICSKEAFFDDYEGEYARSTYCPHCGAKMGQS